MSNEHIVPNNLYPAEGGRRSPWFVDFDTDEPVFEWKTRGVAGHAWRLVVDGELAFENANTAVPATGSRYFIKVDFGTRKRRSIRLELSNSTPFGGVQVPTVGTILRPSAPLGPKVIFLGSSYEEGTGTHAGFQGWPYAAADRLGWRHVESSGSGGTGILNPSTGSGSSKVKYRDRLTVDVTSRNPDVIVIAAGPNDASSYSVSAIGAEAALLYAKARNESPDAFLIAVSNYTTNDSGNVSATILATRDAIKAAALANDVDLFIDTIAGQWTRADGQTGPAQGPWINGTGRSGATTGVGNSDLYIGGLTGSDVVHPTPDGHAYYGARFAADVAAALL